MILYHMSQTLKLADTLTPDHQKNISLVQPFVQALERSLDCFYAMVLNGKYLYAVLGKFKLWEWSDYAKWATEGAFEYSHSVDIVKGTPLHSVLGLDSLVANSFHHQAIKTLAKN